jgi:Zn-dependent protease with chaperone function
MESTRHPRAIRPQPLWVRVDQNRVKLAAFVVSFVVGSALLLSLAFIGVPGSLIGWALEFGETGDLPGYWLWVLKVFLGTFALMLALGAIIAAVQLANAEDWVRGRFGGSDLEPGTEVGLSQTLEDMTLASGLPAAPRLIVLDAESVNACAIGLSRARPVIGVTRGLLSTLDVNEQRAVLATLVARIRSGDILIGTAMAALMGPLKAIRESRGSAGGIAAGCVDAGCSSPGCADEGCGCLFDGFGDADSAGGCLAAIGLAIFAAVVVALTYVAVVLAAWLVTAWGRAIHRSGHEKADAEGMLLLKDPSPMLSALRKAITSSNQIADGDASYDGIFYLSTSGKPAVERSERRRFDRLREVLGTDGLSSEPV